MIEKPRGPRSGEAAGPEVVPYGSATGPGPKRLLLTSRLAVFRARAQLTQADVAKRIQQLTREIDHVVTHTDAGMVSKWERGVKGIDAQNRRALCSLYGATEEQLGIGEGEVPMSAALRGKGMVEWLSDRLEVPISDLNREIDARSATVSTSALAGGSREGTADYLQRYYERDEIANAGFRLYRATANGHEVRTSLVVRPDWVRGRITLGDEDQPGGNERWDLSSAAAPPAPMPAPVLDKALNRLAQVAAAGERAPVMINKPLYSLRDLDFDRGALRATFSVDTFAHYALTYDLLEAELAEAVRQGDRAPLPLRDALLPDVPAVVTTTGRLCAGGLACLLAMARPASRHRPADFAFVVQQRSSKVLNVAGRLSVMPKAFHQHLVSPEDEVSVGTTLRRELEEELFGREDVDESWGRPKLSLTPYHEQALSAPMRWLADEGVGRYECTGAGLNLLAGNFEFACLITIADERFLEKFGASCVANWEAEGITLASTADPDRLTALIADPRWTDEGLFGLIQGLRALQEAHPDRVRLPEIALEVT